MLLQQQYHAKLQGGCSGLRCRHIYLGLGGVKPTRFPISHNSLAIRNAIFAGNNILIIKSSTLTSANHLFGFRHIIVQYDLLNLRWSAHRKVELVFLRRIRCECLLWRGLCVLVE